MANCSQINNTTIKGTSAVTYDSTPLPCTDVTTCDGLNDILSKFDAVICDVKASVDSITEDVINLTEDLMLITEDIVDIQNQIFICCPICEFTGTADQLPDPTTTTTSTSSSTTTTSTSSTTTTTTTEYCYCYTYEVTVTEEDLNESIDGQVSVQFRNCNEDEVTVNYDVSGTYILDVFENEITQTIETISGTMLTENQPINTGFCCYTSPLFTGLRNNTGNETDTCSSLTTQIWLKEDEYGGIIRILYNSSGTIGFNGYDQFWTIQKDSNPPQNFRISNDGYIIEYGNLCL